MAAVWSGDALLGYTASRAHWADVGGSAPGSMPAGSRTLRAEGLIAPPIEVARGWRLDERLVAALLANMRNADERLADLRAQIACHRVADVAAGCARVHAMASSAWKLRARSRSSPPNVPSASASARDPRRRLRGRGRVEGDGVEQGDMPIRVRLTVADDELEIDFAGTAGQGPGNLNCPLAVTRSACLYALRVVAAPDLPASAGALRPVRIVAPEGSLVNARPGAAVAGGNVETSCRVADVVLAAFGQALAVPAQGQGTMNSVTLGTRSWTSYETVGGGQGACPDADGPSGVHVSMSNTLNTPIEAFERAFPVTVQRYALREGSGGGGRRRGGDGVVRALRVDEPCRLDVIAERRRHAPAGAAGGAPGAPGRTLVNGREMPSKCSVALAAGDVVQIETPGGGGYGVPPPG